MSSTPRARPTSRTANSRSPHHAPHRRRLHRRRPRRPVLRQRPSFDGAPAMIRIDKEIDFDWAFANPVQPTRHHQPGLRRPLDRHHRARPSPRPSTSSSVSPSATPASDKLKFAIYLDGKAARTHRPANAHRHQAPALRPQLRSHPALRHSLRRHPPARPPHRVHPVRPHHRRRPLLRVESLAANSSRTRPSTAAKQSRRRRRLRRPHRRASKAKR